MDQAALADQIFFWLFGERSKDANLDRHIDLCSGGHREQALRPGSEPLHNFTGDQHCSFLKSSNLSAG